ASPASRAAADACRAATPSRASGPRSGGWWRCSASWGCRPSPRPRLPAAYIEMCQSCGTHVLGLLPNGYRGSFGFKKRGRLLWLDPGVLDHLGPLLDLGRDELGKLVRRAGQRRDAEPVEAVLHLGTLE